LIWVRPFGANLLGFLDRLLNKIREKAMAMIERFVIKPRQIVVNADCSTRRSAFSRVGTTPFIPLVRKGLRPS